VRHGGFHGAALSLAHEMLEFGECVFDRIEVGAVGWKEQEPCTSTSDDGAHSVAFVAAKVVHDDDVAWSETWEKDLLNIGLEQVAIDRTIEYARCGDSIAAQGSQEGHGFPVPLRHIGLQPFAFPAPAADRRHVGLGPGLIDEDQSRGGNQGLIFLPPIASSGDVRPLPFAGVICFF
jgi:hypothetical protein